MQQRKEFVDAVLASIPPIEDAYDATLMAFVLTRLCNEGWTVAEAAEYAATFEEVNPALPEDEAIARAAAVMARVKKRLFPW